MTGATVNWHGREVKRRYRDAVNDVVADAGEYLLEEANRTVPIEEGTLARSGSVDAGDAEATVSYDTPYAARQHEETSYRHASGRRAKWLQLTFQEQARRIESFLADRLRGLLP